MKRRHLKHTLLSISMIGLSVLGGAWSVTHAKPQEGKVLSKKLVGAWRLVSVEGADPTFGYDHPMGLIIYDRSGWMAVQIAVKGDRKPFVNGPNSGTLEEKAAAFDSYFLYYGTYTLDSKAQTVTHHIEGASYPGGPGRNIVRWFEFQGEDRLLLIPKGNIVDRKNATYKLLWERVR
jgi:hypothetical protein